MQSCWSLHFSILNTNIDHFLSKYHHMLPTKNCTYSFERSFSGWFQQLQTDFCYFHQSRSDHSLSRRKLLTLLHVAAADVNAMRPSLPKGCMRCVWPVGAVSTHSPTWVAAAAGMRRDSKAPNGTAGRRLLKCQPRAPAPNRTGRTLQQSLKTSA